MSKKLILISLLFFSFLSQAQNDWTIYKSINGVNIYTKESDCIFKDGSNMNQRVILFKLENTNNQVITISWTLRVWYGGKEAVNNTTPEERHVKFTINSNSFLQGDCSLRANHLYLYKKYLDFEKSAQLTHFELENLKVTK